MTPPLETIEVACRAWWDATNSEGKRIATVGWDEFAAKHPEQVADYRRRMVFALQAAVGIP